MAPNRAQNAPRSLVRSLVKGLVKDSALLPSSFNPKLYAPDAPYVSRWEVEVCCRESRCRSRLPPSLRSSRGSAAECDQEWKRLLALPPDERPKEARLKLDVAMCQCLPFFANIPPSLRQRLLRVLTPPSL